MCLFQSDVFCSCQSGQNWKDGGFGSCTKQHGKHSMAVEEGIWEKKIHVQTLGFFGQEEHDGEPFAWSYLSAAVL